MLELGRRYALNRRYMDQVAAAMPFEMLKNALREKNGAAELTGPILTQMLRI